jgi:hypothetical protein
MLPISSIRRSYLLALLFSLLTCQFALAASLIPDKSEIAIGETTYIKLDADVVLTIDWSATPGIVILDSGRSGATVKGAAAGPATVTAKINGKKKSLAMSVRAAGTSNAAASSPDVARQTFAAPAVSMSLPAGETGWVVAETTPGMYRVERAPGQVRIARQANSPGGLQHAGLRLDRGLPVTGDFDAQVSFADARIEGGLNQVELHAFFADDSIFFVVRDREGNGSHIWAPGLQGNQTCGNAGTLRMERRSEMVTGYCDGRAIWSAPHKAALTKLQFVLQNNGTNDPISVTFRDYQFKGVATSTASAPVQLPAKARLVLEDDTGPYTWIEGTEVQTKQVHAGRAAFRATGNNHFTHRLGIAGNYADQFRHLDFWIYLMNPSADIQLQVQVDGAWGKRWGFDGDAIYNGYNWAMEGTTTGLPSGRWLHQRVDLLQQLHLDAGQAITGLAFSSDGGDVYYDSVYLLPSEKPTPPPRGTPSGKRVLEDDAGPYNWLDKTSLQKEVVAFGEAAFRSTGNNHFLADLGVVGDYPEQFRSLSFWLFPIGAEADLQLQVQVDGVWGKRWGFDAGPVYNGYNWAMEGTTTNLKHGQWQEVTVDLLNQLHINPGQKITGLAFSSDNGDVYYDSVYLHPNPNPALKPSFQPAGKLVLEDSTEPYNWLDRSELESYLVFNGAKAFRSTGNNHFLADLGVAGSGGGPYRYLNFWAFFMGPEADMQVQVQVNGNWGKRWGYDAGPVYNGYNWAMEGASTRMPNGRWTQIQLDLIGQLHLNPGDKITGLAFSSDNADVIYDSVYLLPDGAAPVVGGGVQGGGRDYTYTQPGGRDYTGQVPIGQVPITPANSAVLFDNGNIAGVDNGPSQPTSFYLDAPHVITLIQDYHWNNARGATPGMIGLRDTNGSIYGPWQSVGSPGQGGVPNAYWTAHPNITLPTGIYSVIDSHPASWSRNGGSQQRGFTRVEGYLANPSAINPAGTTEPSLQEQADQTMKALKGLFGK